MRSSAAGLQFAIARERGTLADIVPLGPSVPHRPPSLVEAATGALGQLDQGDREGARALLDGFDGELRSLQLGSVAASVWSQLAEVACRLHDERRAVQLAELLTPFRGQLIVVAWGVYVTGIRRSLPRHAGGDPASWDDADAAFASALRLEESIDSVPLAARTRTWWARSLLDQGGDGNVDAGERIARDRRPPSARPRDGRPLGRDRRPAPADVAERPAAHVDRALPVACRRLGAAREDDPRRTDGHRSCFAPAPLSRRAGQSHRSAYAVIHPGEDRGERAS